MEAGTGTDERALTPARVKQAIAANAVALASQAEAEAGTNNTKMMTPLRTSQAIAALAPITFVDATNKLSLGDRTGDARGNDTIDLQVKRSNVNQVAEGAGSIAIGFNQRVPGANSIGIGAGHSSGLQGNYAIAIGNGPQVTGNYGIAMGMGAIAHANCIAIRGNAGADPTNIYDIVIGGSVSGYGRVDYGIAIGGQVSANRAMALGFGVSNGVENSVKIGFNSGSNQSFSFNQTDGLVTHALRINAAPTVAVVAQSHWVPVNINGTSYKLLLAS